ncbi:MAG TPA: AraC family transcriptional regulator [Panacibacter sp.]|nr:AraC family transcriptional regulator [Panacibacter sp.]HNP45235.1 AraC family transcriptional regulator [Panacibacter sp.]
MQGSQTRSAISQEANSIQYKGNNSGLRPSAISTRFKPVISYIQKNLQEEISIETLSRAAFMSEPHFYRSFKKQFGVTPVEYINGKRIRTAMMMMQAADCSLREIAFASGFNNLTYFFRTFKRCTGCTPGEYRKSIFS